ncbi:MAG: gamma-glutamyl-gamma-aminobutyrate hydrolase family protein, partial [Rhodospirillaceae bacterium]|nr:gamma-glutamyl-gamma-aminobutyrate hydrolase family protein [Rhodospirillaceae bacterium]
DIIRAPKPMHGKVDKITHNAQGVFKDIPSPIEATRYHSLTIDPKSFPDCLEITATSDDGVIQGLRHKTRPIFGVQFHPESIASQHGHDILKNFLDISKSRKAAA